MSGYVLFVDFHLKPGALEKLREFVDANARQSAQTEPGCRRFDVIEPETPPPPRSSFMKYTATERTSTRTCDRSTMPASTPQARDSS
jgi:quinol monooxygenase YgiN